MPRLPQLWSRATAAQEVYFSPDPRRRIVVAVLLTLVAFPLSVLGYGFFGPPSVATNLVAVAVIAGLFGLRAGVPYAVIAALASAWLLNRLGDARWPSMFAPGLIALELAAVVVAVIAGRLHDVGIWLRERQLSLADSEGRLRLMLDNLPIVLLGADVYGRFLFHAGAGLRRVGSVAATPGDSLYERYRTRPEHIGYFERARAGEDVHATIDWDGHEFETFWAPMRTPDGAINGVVAIASDETARRSAERALQEMRTHDALTSFANREAFIGALESQLASGRRFSVLTVAIDNLREVNEGLGHTVGDEVLREIGRRLTLQHIEFPARVDGAEFAMIVPGVTEDAASVAAEIATAVESPVGLADVAVQVVVFMGVAPASATHSGAALLREATVAAELARRGDTTYAIYNASQDRHRAGGIGLAAELRHAIEAGELTLEYQPIVDLADRTVRSVEALVRWRHPTRGLVPPADFIPLAERTGLIRPMTKWILRRALEDARELLAPHDIEVSVNLSMRDLHDEELPATVYSLLRDTTNGVPLRLRLEVTESAVMADAQRAVGALTTLREMGVRLAIDDFGTGYSSLSYLQRLPVDTLKIDRSFVRDLPRDPARRAIIHAVVELGRALGLSVVAEGVEDDATRAALIELGCDRAQGFGIARPMSFHAMRERLSKLEMP